MSQKISQFPSITPAELDKCMVESESTSSIKSAQCIAGCSLVENNIWKNVSISLTDYFYTKGQIKQLLNAGVVTLSSDKMVKTNTAGSLVSSSLSEDDIITHLQGRSETVLHTTQAEKNAWNAKQNAITGMGSIVATKANSTADVGKLMYIDSNGKVNISALTISAINTHFEDNVRHITAAERAKWNKQNGFMFLDYANGYTIHWTEDYNETNYSSTNKNTTIYPEYDDSLINKNNSRHVFLHPRWIKLKAGAYQPSVTQFIDTNYQNLFKVNGAVNNDRYKALHTRWFDTEAKAYKYKGKASTSYSAGNDLHLYPFYRAIDYTWSTETDSTKNGYPLHSAIIPPLPKNALYIIDLWEGEYSYNGETARIDYKAPGSSSWVYIGSYPSMGETRLNLPIPAGGSIKITNIRAGSFSAKIIAFPCIDA